MNASDGVVCRDYLCRRSIEINTACALDFGFVPDLFDPVDKSKRPSLLIPWIDGVGTIFAIKYRYIDEVAETDKGRRFRQESGSDPTLFGLNTASVGNTALIAVEGEINAASIFQAMKGESCDVVSIGSERNSKALEVLDRLIAGRGYSETLIWLDAPETALRVGDRLDAHRPILMKSPNNRDANDLLCAYGPKGLRDLVLEHLGSCVKKHH
jgi:hypothetical protein